MLAEDLGAESALEAPGSAAPLPVYLHRVWKMRHYAYSSARNGISASNSSNLLGNLWLLLEPAMLIGVYFVIFGLVLDVRRGEGYVAFLTVGQLVFTHSRRGITLASSSLLTKAPMLKSFAFPRAVLPLIATLNALFTFLVSLVVMISVIVALGERPRLGWLWFVPLIGMQAVLNLGLGLVLARMVSVFADLRTALTYLFRLTLYASGVIFPMQGYLEELDSGSFFLHLSLINPFYDLIHLFRWAALGTKPLTAGPMVVVTLVWCIGALVVGTVWFIRGERNYSGAKTVLKL